ncbi:MAG: hypothetical protein HUJ58_09545, partial [Erysipelotrichaceae bacterium]|nr:hypothetical protein [Erysipelotrichaceae bacterium]
HGIVPLGDVLQDILEVKFHGLCVKDNEDDAAWVKEAIVSFEPLSEYVIFETEPDCPDKVDRLRQTADVNLCIFTGVCPVKPDAFRTQEQNITRGKEAVRLCKEDGVAVVNLDDEAGKETYPCKTVTYSFEDMADYRILDFHTGIHGSTFLLAMKNESLPFTTTWCGTQMVTQLAGMIAGAHVTGIPLEQLQAIVSRLPQKTGCNSVTEYEGRWVLDQSRLTYYDHIFCAKDILEGIEGKLVVITSGMKEQDEENYSLGRQLACMTDCVVAIGKTEGEALEEGLLDGNPDAVCYIVNNPEQAMQKALSLTETNDVIWMERRG